MENQVNFGKKLLKWYLLLFLAIIVFLFILFKPYIDDYKLEKRILTRYEEMIQFSIENSKELEVVSKILIDNTESIQNYLNFDLQQIAHKLNNAELEACDKIFNTVSYNSRYNFNNDRKKEVVYYLCDYIAGTDIQIIYISNGKYEFGQLETMGSVTKITEEIYVVCYNIPYE